MSRGAQINRHWRLLLTLQRRGQGLTLRELADEFDVSERTLQRDFEALQEVGIPIEHEADEIGRRFWRLPADFLRTSPLVISLTEAISLHLAEHLFAPLAGTQFAAGLQSTLAKIRSLLPARALEYFRALDQTVHVRRVGVTDYAAHADTIATLTTAVSAQRIVELTYQSLWRADRYGTRFDPYGLVFFDGDLFAIGRSHRAGAVRVLKISRISAATLTADVFERPADFDLAAFFRGSFGIVQARGEPLDIEVRFRGPGAALVEERIWHESQQLEWLPAPETLFEPLSEQPEELRATFRLANVVEFKRWLRGFGDTAEIVRPAWLRAEFRAELLAAADRHAD